LLQVAEKAGKNIVCDNYHAQASIADRLINKLFAIVSGNSLGEFRDPPVCLGWFQAKQEKSPNNGNPNNTRDRSPKNAPGTPDLLHDNKKPRPNQEDIERNKTMGILLFGPDTGGNNGRLPHCDVYSKNAVGKQERICMQFCTVGYFCSQTKCPFPHIHRIGNLAPEQKKEFTNFVNKTPGLSFKSRKGPAGTPKK
jgi:hypothetical protein